MNLTKDAMLVSLRINAWSGRLYDRQASRQVAIHHDADASTGRYNKRLLPKPAFAALAATMSKARTTHYENTLLWDDQGSRLLTVANYDRYTAALDALTETERMVRECAHFIEDYDDHVGQARLDLDCLFRIEDYPRRRIFRGKFAIAYRIVPVPDADHFIAQLAQDDAERHQAGHGMPNPGPSARRPAISTVAWARRWSVSASACARTRTASRSYSATA